MNTQPLDMPDGPGWWAFEGKHKIWSGRPYRAVYHVRLNIDEKRVDFLNVEDARTDKDLLYFVEGCYGNKSVTTLVGTWTRIYMPWDEPATPAAIPDDLDNDPLGVHAQRWVRLDWNTAAALHAVLDGDIEAGRVFVQMLLMQAETELNTPQPAAQVTQEVVEAIELTLGHAEHCYDLSPEPDEFETVRTWLSAQRTAEGDK